MIIPQTKSIEITSLTEAMASVVPRLTGLVDQGQTLLIRHDGQPEFSVAEQASLLDVYQAHDSTSIQQSKDDRQRQRETQRKLSPLALALPDRVRRLEILLGAD